jgi:hypothetical protein
MRANKLFGLIFTHFNPISIKNALKSPFLEQKAPFSQKHKSPTFKWLGKVSHTLLGDG